MYSNIDSILRAILVSTPVAAALLFLFSLFLKARWKVAGSGIKSALLFAVIGLALFGKDLNSDSGWGWVAVGAAFMIGIYACAGFIFGIGVAAAISKRYRCISALPILFGLLSPVTMPLHNKIVRAESERRWTEEQEMQRRNPHALVNDIALLDEEDSGYRIRFVDDKGVVRANSESIEVTPYVVLSPGKHRIVLHGDTPKAVRLKLEWSLQDSVEVEAGCLYNLQVTNGQIRLKEVDRFKEPNPESCVRPERSGAVNTTHVEQAREDRRG